MCSSPFLSPIHPKVAAIGDNKGKHKSVKGMLK